MSKEPTNRNRRRPKAGLWIPRYIVLHETNRIFILPQVRQLWFGDFPHNHCCEIGPMLRYGHPQ